MVNRVDLTGPNWRKALGCPETAKTVTRRMRADGATKAQVAAELRTYQRDADGSIRKKT